VNGSAFVSGATVQWNGSARTTTYVSSSQLTASIAAADVAAAGTATVVVANPDGTKSSAASFTISAPAAISSLVPSSAMAAGAAFTLTVNGSGFVSGAMVQWNGVSRTTTFVSATQVTAAISTADLAAPGTIPVVVANPDGSKSSSLPFTITSATPATLGSLSPNTADAGGSSLNLTVTGSGFLPGAIATWNGSNRTTTYTSATQLTAQLAASDLASAGTGTIQVVQGGVTSTNQLSFTTIPLTISSPLSPATTPAMGAAFTLTVNGAGFFNDSAVQWNGSNRTTTYVSATKLTAAITAADIASAGPASVKVVTPSSGNAGSNTLTFTITPVGTIQQLASANTAGMESNNASFRALVSNDGRYVSFPSLASDLIANDTNASPDVFVRDTCLGAAPAGCTLSTTRVSLDNSNNELVNGIDGIASPMSVDGRYFAYPKRSFLEDDMRDTCTGVASGCTTSTTPVSLPNGGGAAVAVDPPIAISPDGRYVGFTSPATTLVSGVTVTHQAYVRDTCVGATGCTPTTTHVSIGNNGSASIPPNGGYIGAISRGGRYVLFSALDTNVLPGLTLGKNHLFMRDTCTGVSSGCTPTTTLIDVGTDGKEGNDQLNTDPAGDNPGTFSLDARYVLFNSKAANLVSGTLFQLSEVYLRDTCNGVPSGCIPSTTMVSVAEGGVTNGSSNYVGSRSLSSDGRYATFISSIPGIAAPKVYVRDTCTGAGAGCTPTTAVILDPTGLAGPQPGFIYPSISGDGHYVVFTLTGRNGAAIAAPQVYVAKTGY
jgi:hypothetical protein